MASASQSFPTRPFSNILHGKLPERGGGGGGGFGLSTAGRGNQQSQQQQSGINNRGDIVGGVSNSGGNASNITDEQREEINEAFALFDLDKDQRIDYHEFKVSLKALGFTLSKPELLNLLTTHGMLPPPSPSHPPLKRNQQQQPETVHPSRLVISQPSFLQIASNLISQRDPRDEIMRAFDLFDSEGKGVITVEDLRRVARELGEGLEEDEMRAMIEEFDMEGKGGVDREEFVSICLG